MIITAKDLILMKRRPGHKTVVQGGLLALAKLVPMLKLLRKRMASATGESSSDTRIAERGKVRK